MKKLLSDKPAITEKKEEQKALSPPNALQSDCDEAEKEEKPYYIYMLRCKGNALYTGITTEPDRRFFEHSGKRAGGAKYTKAHRPLFPAALWLTQGRASASRLEYRIKKLPKIKKEALVSGSASLDEILGEAYSPKAYQRQEVKPSSK